MRATAPAGLVAVFAFGTTLSLAQAESSSPPPASSAAPAGSGSSAPPAPPGSSAPSEGSAAPAAAGAAALPPPPVAEPPSAPAGLAPAGESASAFPPGSGPVEPPPTSDPAGRASERTPPESTLGLSLDLGVGARLEGTSDGYREGSPGGVAVSFGVWLAPSRVLELGVLGQRAQLGTERSAPVGRSVTVERTATTAWLAARAFPLRSDTLGLFVHLGLGGSWQSIQATGTHPTGTFTAPAPGFECSSVDGPALALGAGLGLDAALRRDVDFVAGVDVGAHQFSGAEISPCGPGAATATLLTGRVGFVWRYDLAGADEPPSGE